MHITPTPRTHSFSFFLSYSPRKLKLPVFFHLLSHGCSFAVFPLGCWLLLFQTFKCWRTPRLCSELYSPTALSLGELSYPHGFKRHSYTHDSQIYVCSPDHYPKLQTAYTVSPLGNLGCPKQNFSVFSQTCSFPGLPYLVNGSII